MSSLNSSKSIKKGNNNLQYTKRKQKISIKVNEQTDNLLNKQSKFRQNLPQTEKDNPNINLNDVIRHDRKMTKDKFNKMIPYTQINSQNNSNYNIASKKQDEKTDGFLKIPS